MAEMKMFSIQISETDLGQLIDGLCVRADAWEKTARYHRTGEVPHDILVEECRDAEEAEQIAEHYGSIIANIRKQKEEQSG
jgi:hypothetical protein